MALLFYLSSLRFIPGADRLWDKGAHFAAYALLAGLALRAFHGGFLPPRRLAVLGALVLTIAFGVFDEIHQSFVPGRSPSGLDVFADSLGAASAAAAMVWVSRRFHRVGAQPLPEITLVEKAGCHLCHDALAHLEAVRREIPFRLVRREVDTTPEERTSLGGEVPVVFLDGKKLFKYRVDRDRLRTALRARLRPGGA